MRTNVVLGLQVLRRASAFLTDEKDVPAKMGSIPKHVESLNGAIAQVEKYAREQALGERNYQAATPGTSTPEGGKAA